MNGPYGNKLADVGVDVSKLQETGEEPKTVMGFPGVQLPLIGLSVANKIEA
jgi:hypothetical protein